MLWEVQDLLTAGMMFTLALPWCVCAHVCVCLVVFTCVCLAVFTCVFGCGCAHMCVCILRLVCVYAHVCVCLAGVVCVLTCAYVCLCVCGRMCPCQPLGHMEGVTLQDVTVGRIFDLDTSNVSQRRAVFDTIDEWCVWCGQ